MTDIHTYVCMYIDLRSLLMTDPLHFRLTHLTVLYCILETNSVCYSTHNCNPSTTSITCPPDNCTPLSCIQFNLITSVYIWSEGFSTGAVMRKGWVLWFQCVKDSFVLPTFHSGYSDLIFALKKAWLKHQKDKPVFHMLESENPTFSHQSKYYCVCITVLRMDTWAFWLRNNWSIIFYCSHPHWPWGLYSYDSGPISWLCPSHCQLLLDCSGQCHLWRSKRHLHCHCHLREWHHGYWSIRGPSKLLSGDTRSPCLCQPHSHTVSRERWWKQ